MEFSATFTRKLMEIKAQSICKPKLLKQNNNNNNEGDKCLYSNDNYSCNCELYRDVKPYLEYCNCINILLDNNITTINDEQYNPYELHAEQELIMKFSKLSLKRKRYRQIISPYHRHIYKNYTFTNIGNLNKYYKKCRKFANEYEIINEYIENKIYPEDFWNCYAVDNLRNGLQIIKKLIYRNAPLKSIDNELDKEKYKQNVFHDMWRLYRVDSICFYNWIYKLRLWLSATILTRIVDEIDNINKELTSLGFRGLLIGNTGLNILETISPSLIGTLPMLLTFLELTSYQSYIVQRIRILAKSGCMNEYNWNSGGIYCDQPWKSHLPTDSKLIMHLFCTYLDHMLPLTCIPKHKPFTRKYFTNNKQILNNGNTKIKIIETTELPPHYKLLMDGQIQELPSGRNNLFYAILLFLKYIQKNESAVLDNISLGQCGLNMLWIVT